MGDGSTDIAMADSTDIAATIMADSETQVVVNSCFEGLEGRMGLKRVREFIPKAGKKRSERVKVSSYS